MRRLRRFFVGVLVTLGLVLGATVVIFGPFLYLTYDWIPTSPRPSDEAMIAHFRAKRPVFEQLVAMIKENPQIERLAADFSKPENLAAIGVGPERIVLYRRLLQEADMPKGFQNYTAGRSITFIFQTSGLSIRGSGKGFVYGEAPRAAEEIDSDLNRAAEGRRNFFLIRKIDKEWWIELDST